MSPETQVTHKDFLTANIDEQLREHVVNLKKGLSFNPKAWENLKPWEKSAKNIGLVVNAATEKNEDYPQLRVAGVRGEHYPKVSTMLEAAARLEAVVEGLAGNKKYAFTKHFLQEKADNLIKAVERQIELGEREDSEESRINKIIRNALLSTTVLMVFAIACTNGESTVNNDPTNIEPTAEEIDPTAGVIDQADLPDSPWDVTPESQELPTPTSEQLPTEEETGLPTSPTATRNFEEVWSDWAESGYVDDLKADLIAYYGPEANQYEIMMIRNGLGGDNFRAKLIPVYVENDGTVHILWAEKGGSLSAEPNFNPAFSQEVKDQLFDGFRELVFDNGIGGRFLGEHAQLVNLDTGEVYDMRTGQFMAAEEATETAGDEILVAPYSWTDNDSALSAMGYEITHDEAQNVIQLTAADQERPVLVAESAHEMRLEVQNVIEIDKDGNYQPAELESVVLPAENFAIQETIGLGVKKILTIKNEAGEVAYFYLPSVEAWVTPIQAATDPEMLRPENIAQVPEITMSDVWSGRLTISEALRAEPFDEDTMVPDEFVYYFFRARGGFNISVMGSFDDGIPTDHPRINDVTQETDYRKFPFFYRAVSPDGVEMKIITQQTAHTDDKHSIFFHYAIGPEIPADRDAELYGLSVNLVESFININIGEDSDEIYQGFLSPVVIFDAFSEEAKAIYFSKHQDAPGEGTPTAGVYLYSGDYVFNQPWQVHEGLVARFIELSNENERAEVLQDLPVSDDALEELQSMLLLGEFSQPVSGYFEN